MKVLFICCGHFDSGLELFKEISSKINCYLLVQMEGDSINQSVINMKTDDIPFGLTINVNETKLYESISALFGLDSEHIVFAKYNSLSFRDKKNFKISKEVTAWVRKEKFDIVHYYGSSLTWIQQLFFLKGVKRIYTVHDYLPHSGEGENSYQYKFYMKFITSIRTNYFLLLSEKMMNAFIKYYNIDHQKCSFIHFGSFDSYNKFNNSKIEEEESTILFFGRISPYKGLEYLVEAVEKIKVDFPTIKVIIAGKGDFYFDSGKLLYNPMYEIHNKYISNEFLAELLQKCSFVVCPYTDATQSGVVMTAYAFNKPVIATDVGSFREYVIDGETGFIVEPKNSEKLADAIKNLISNQDLIEQMQENIVRIKETKFSWHKAAEDIVELYFSCS